MRGFWAVCKREMKAYFTTPVAYVFLVVFLFFAGYLPFRKGWYDGRQADLRLFFDSLPLLLAIFVPCISMRLWSEERRSGTIELLLTLPISPTQAALGKFAAAWAFLAIALILTIPMPIITWYLGDPDNGPIICGYAASFLMAGTFLAIGCFFSALSKNQIVSLILTVVVCGVLVYLGMPTTLNYLSAALPKGMLRVAEGLSMLTHFESMGRGVLELRDLVYFAAMIAGWVWAGTMVLEDRRAA